MRIEILGIDHIQDTEKDELFISKLEDAKHIALNHIYPYNKEIDELPTRLINWQTRAAIELYNRLGDEGLTSYSENGLSYSYKSDLLSEELLNELPPANLGVIF